MIFMFSCILRRTDQPTEECTVSYRFTWKASNWKHLKISIQSHIFSHLVSKVDRCRYIFSFSISSHKEGEEDAEQEETTERKGEEAIGGGEGGMT